MPTTFSPVGCGIEVVLDYFPIRFQEFPSEMEIAVCIAGVMRQEEVFRRAMHRDLQKIYADAARGFDALLSERF